MKGGKQLIAVVGPTASGKTSLALELAKKFKGEIISADSRAIYRGMRIGTDRVPGKWKSKGRSRVFTYQGVPHHLLDFVSPKKSWSAHDFAKTAGALIDGIDKPFVVGGTGFWIQALVEPGLLAGSPPNAGLRKSLEKKTIEELFQKLKKIDAARAKTIQKSNKRRLIRAIEIAGQKGGRREGGGKTSYDVLYIGLTHPNQVIKKKIRKRFIQWLKQGLVTETKKLRQQVSHKRLKEIGLMYPVIAEYLDEKITREQMIERSVNSIYHYAKRQKTWFKKNKDIHWVKNRQQAYRLAKNFFD